MLQAGQSVPCASAVLLFAPSRLLGHGKADPRLLCLNCGLVSFGVCPVAALCPQSLQAGVGVMGSVGYPLQHALWAPMLTAAASAAVCFQIFGIFLARTLISDIEAVKAGHHF